MRSLSKTLTFAIATGIIGWAIYYAGLALDEPRATLSSYAKTAALVLMTSAGAAFFELFRNTFKGAMRGLGMSSGVLAAHFLILTLNGWLRLLY